MLVGVVDVVDGTNLAIVTIDEHFFLRQAEHFGFVGFGGFDFVGLYYSTTANFGKFVYEIQTTCCV
jgi:hypothetical protein